MASPKTSSYRRGLPLLGPAGIGHPGLHIGQTTRRGGVSQGAYADCNLAGHVGEVDELTEENWRRFTKVTGWRREEVATARQVHGDRILSVAQGGSSTEEADALISLTPGVAVGVFTADCVPVLLVARTPAGDIQGVAAVHCGWRGAAAGLAGKAVRTLSDLTAVPPKNVSAWLGAAVAARSYEVGGEVARRFASAHYSTGVAGKFQLDVGGAVREDLLAAGLLGEHVERCPLDTYTQPERLYSYRRDGATTGRMLSFAGWRA